MRIHLLHCKWYAWCPTYNSSLLVRANLQIFQEFFWRVVKIKNYIIETCDYISYIKEATLNIYHFIMILLCLSIICALEVICMYNNHKVKILCNGHCTFLPATVL